LPAESGGPKAPLSFRFCRLREDSAMRPAPSKSVSTKVTHRRWSFPATLWRRRKPLQRIKIFDSVANGRVLILDDIVQMTTRDESAYAEMLTHLPILEHGAVERVMIVGGGDLSIADEALKHKAVKEVVLVDIDGRVVELCRKHSPRSTPRPSRTNDSPSRSPTPSNISAAKRAKPDSI